MAKPKRTHRAGMPTSCLDGDDLVPYNHPAAAKAREVAHTMTFGKGDMALLCADALARHTFVVALLEWCCNTEGWLCVEHEPGVFTMRGGTLYVLAEIRGTSAPEFKGSVRIETFSGTA